VKPYRSMLFVPGHKSSWAEKAVASGADALILDLEDSVPDSEKDVARGVVHDTLERLSSAGASTDLWVRPNSHDSGLLGADLEAIVVPGLRGLYLPKVIDAREVIEVAAVLSHIEQREGLDHGQVQLIPSFETAASMAHCEEIAAASPRVATLVGGTGPNADVGRELGFEFTVDGLETLYLRSRIILAARSNGLHHPLAGVWQDVADLDGFRRFAAANRGLGFRGMVLIHPSHVSISNEMFAPDAETVDYYRRMIIAFREAEAAGSAAVNFEGRMIDIAHLKTAEDVVGRADAFAGVPQG
jgi:citrate lyase subunit beta/citryl-CoA lyase